jgi:hypothetical protein
MLYIYSDKPPRFLPWTHYQDGRMVTCIQT